MLDMTTFDEALKVHYGPQRLKKIGYEGRPLLGMIEKYENFGGRNLPLPVRFAKPQNLAADFSAASRAGGSDPSTSSSSLAEFLLTRKKKYGNAFLDRQTILASEGDVNAFARAATFEIDGAIEQVSDDVHVGLFASGTGSRGVIGVVDGGDARILTLTNVEDISKFEVGMAVKASTTTEVAILRTDLRTVVAVDRSAGIVTTDVAITGVTAADHLFRYGDRQDAAITAASQYLNPMGLADWLPLAAPTSGDNFLGVDRSIDTDRLAGIRVPFTTSYRKTIMAASIETGRQGARGAKTLVVNPTDLQAIMFEYDDKVEHAFVSAPDLAGFGFEAISIKTPMGEVKVVADHQCPVGLGYLLDLRTWKLYSIQGAPHMIDESGKYLRNHSADTYKVEIAAYYQLGCDAPGRNAVVSWA